jgi:hypothetical protein
MIISVIVFNAEKRINLSWLEGRNVEDNLLIGV